VRFSSATIADLKLDAGLADKIVFDDDVPGFGIRVRASGARTWIFQYKIGGRTRRLVLGKVSAIKLAKARDIAGELHAKVRLGGDPASEKREKVQRALDTFGSLVDLFLAQYRARASTKDGVDRHLRKYAAPLHPMPVTAIGRRDIAELLAKIDKTSGPTTANRVRATLSACFSWAIREGLALSNPIANTKSGKSGPGTGVLSNDELRRIWKTAGDDTYGVIIKLLILTGQRRSEIAKLCWAEVDLERHTLNLSAERTKNKRQHVVPLAPTALALLRDRPRNSDDVLKYASWAYAKNLLNNRSGVSDWVVHTSAAR
jgi:site-specific recombinase XerD